MLPHLYECIIPSLHTAFHPLQGNFAKAIECYTFATEMDPKNPVYFTNRSMCYFKMGDFAKSLRDANKSIALNNNWVKGYYRAGMAEIEMGDYKAAVKHLKTASDLDPNTPAYAQAAEDAKKRMYATMTKAEITKSEGNDFFTAGEIDKAIDKYTLAISQVNLNDEANKDKNKGILADIYANRAMCYQQRWDGKAVIADCDKALDLVPTHVKALVRRAQAYESLEKYAQSLADFEAAVSLEPNMEVAYKGAVRVRGTLRSNKMM